MNKFAKDSAFQREHGPMLARKRRARARLMRAFFRREVYSLAFKSAAKAAAKTETHTLFYGDESPRAYTYITYKGLVQVWIHLFRDGDMRKAGARRKTNG